MSFTRKISYGKKNLWLLKSTKIKKRNIVNVEITHKIRTLFKTLASKKVPKWRLKKSQSNDKLSRKVMSFSYHRE